jgi:hypothetical protein
MEQRSLLPPRFRPLSGSALKLLALFAMLVDHSAICFAPLLDARLFVLRGTVFTPYLLLRGFGRIAFPLFCFLLAEGFRHTRSRARYALGLLVFALLSELPYNLFNTGAFTHPRQNVFFTLLLGFLGIWVLERYRKETWKAGLLLLLLFAVSVLLKADYGWAGFLFILLTWLLAEQPVLQLFAGVALLPWPVGVALAYVPMNLYSGKRGFIRGALPKYACYVFYPAHLLLLWLLHRHFFGY